MEDEINIKLRKKIEVFFENFLFNSRFLAILPVIGILIASVIMFLKGSIEIIQGINFFSTIMTQFTPTSLDDKTLILSFIPAIDNYLFAIFLLIFGMGIYELFISEIDTASINRQRPNWLEIGAFDDLTRREAEVVIMILIIEFFKQAFTIQYNNILDLVFLSIGIILITFSLFVTARVKHTNDTALQVNPDNEEESYNKGNVLSKTGKYDEAIEHYNKAIQINPKKEEAWYKKGNALFKTEKYDEAIECYEEVLQINPNNENAWYNRACVYSIKGDKESTISNLTKAIDINASNKEKAKVDKDFEKHKDDDAFKKLVS